MLVVLTTATRGVSPVYPADGMDSMYAFQEIPAVSSWSGSVTTFAGMFSEDGVPSSVTPELVPDSNSR